MTRRPHGAGTVYQHATTGKWIAQLNLGTDPTTGKRRRITRSADTTKHPAGNLGRSSSTGTKPSTTSSPSSATSRCTTYDRSTSSK